MENSISPRARTLDLDAPGVDEVPKLIKDVLQRLGAAAVFGEPIRNGDTMIVPVAEVRVGFGFGSGAGRGDSGETGGGGGGGGGGKVVPLGYIHVRPDGAHFEPTLDLTTLALGALACTAAVAIAVFGMSR